MQRIDVLGSVNVDLVSVVERLPAPGETVAGGEMAVLLGGKGANQAIAAARAGGNVAMWGAVGAQSFGLDPIAEIGASGVDVAGLARLGGPTGAALIAVDGTGENSIVVSPGANARAAEAVDPSALTGEWLLAQMELPPALVAEAFQAAKARGARTILNAAPALPPPEGLLEATDFLILNETELAAWSGVTVGEASRQPDIAEAAAALAMRPDQTVIVTLGAKGALTFAAGAIIETHPCPAVVVDTTGAGDCFCGALAARLAEAVPLDAALRFAAAAAAISVGRPGAASSMPRRAEIEATLS